MEWGQISLDCAGKMYNKKNRDYQPWPEVFEAEASRDFEILQRRQFRVLEVPGVVGQRAASTRGHTHKYNWNGLLFKISKSVNE